MFLVVVEQLTALESALARIFQEIICSDDPKPGPARLSNFGMDLQRAPAANQFPPTPYGPNMQGPAKAMETRCADYGLKAVLSSTGWVVLTSLA